MHLAALLLNEWTDVRSLIWELCGSHFPPDSSELLQSDVRGPPSVHLASECHVFPQGPFASRWFPADNTQHLQELHLTDCTPQWLWQVGVVFFFASVGTTTMETCLINSLEQFSFLWATGKHPTQLWYTLNRISMRLKILIVSLKFIVGRFQHLYASRFVFLRHSIQPVYHLQY